MRIEGKY